MDENDFDSFEEIGYAFDRLLENAQEWWAVALLGKEPRRIATPEELQSLVNVTLQVHAGKLAESLRSENVLLNKLLEGQRQ